MKSAKFFISALVLLIFAVYNNGCNYITHRTLAIDNPYDSSKSDQDPNYNVSLDYNYQDFVGYFYMGNRIENFTAYFNTFFKSQEDFNDGYDEYRASLISLYNTRLDSLAITPPVSGSVKDKLDKAIERSSKIIQFHKNSKFIDDAVLIIGKSYYFEGSYFKAERTFNEFLSKFSSSDLADEAILFLGQTKMKIDKKDEGEKIFKNLAEHSTSNEIRSQATRNLGIIAYNNGNYQDAVNYFNSSIDFSTDKERKAENQFILAKIISGYKPELSAAEYKKVLDYSSDFDLSFYARLNYAKGLVTNKEYANADDELESLRRKYRDEVGYTQLVDLVIANNLYAQKKYPEALDKYYEVIVKYPNTPSSADAYYYLGMDDEITNKDYMGAYVNFKKATEENTSSDYYKESLNKSATFEKYFALKDEVVDSSKVKIPTANAGVEKYRLKYNEEKGIEQPAETIGNTGIENGNENKNGTTPDGDQKGNGKGKPGGFKFTVSKFYEDSLKQEGIETPPPLGIPSDKGPPDGDRRVPPEKKGEEKNNEGKDNEGKNIDGKHNDVKNTPKEEPDSVSLAHNNDSVRATLELQKIKDKDDKTFNAYYELAELFMYNINQSDSAEFYLKLLLSRFPDSERQAKILYTLGNFYKNAGKKTDADQTFEKIISTYPNTIYASESKKVLGIKVKSDDVTQNPIDELFTNAFNLFNKNKFEEAISVLEGIEINYPNDTLVAKSLYSIGWIYENKLVNKDSSLFYYRKLEAKFPESEYYLKIMPMMEYIASIEAAAKDSAKVKTVSTDSTKENSAVSDSTKEVVKETTSPEEVKEAPPEEVKKENPGEVTVDPGQGSEENKLSQEEIDKLLKEGDQEGK